MGAVIFDSLRVHGVADVVGFFSGIYVPNLAKVIHERNISPKHAKHRIPIHLESVVMTNACSDEVTQTRFVLPS